MSPTADRARALARSGDYANWSYIEAKLRRDGYDDALRVLGSPVLREELDRLCKAARNPSPPQE